MSSRLLAAACAVAAGLALGACSGDVEPQPSPTATSPMDPSATPTPGTLVGEDAFALTLPKGWSEEENAGGALVLGISDQSVGGYPMNVHVVEDSTLAEEPPEQIGQVRADVLADDEAVTDVSMVGDEEIDGEQGVRTSYTRRVGALSVDSDEIAVTHGDTGYIVTFSFPLSVADAERDAVVASMMDTWTWAQ
jgi:hypothetical protein